MSWMENFQNVAFEDIEMLIPKNEATRQEGAQEQFNAARELAADLIYTGNLGEVDKYYFNLTLAGHYEPNHTKRDGWSPDTIAINVSQGGVRTEVLANS